jgi:ribosome-binding protein aMBF1 (putative translation factor)
MNLRPAVRQLDGQPRELRFVIGRSATRLAYELGVAARELRERHSWSQTQLANAAGMTESAVARFEAGGTVPTLPVRERLAQALDVDLAVQFKSRSTAA